MIKTLVHFSDLHIRLYKDHDLYRSILETAIGQWKELSPDRIIFTGDLVHSKNQLTPELIEIVSWLLKECSYVAKTIIISGNHDGLINNLDRLDSNTTIFVYCQSGMRSKKAVEILRRNQFLKVQSITGGALKLEEVLERNSVS